MALVTRGRPPNGASGCHVWWEGLPDEPLVEAAATLEVLRAPDGPRISFWALQVTFVDGDRPTGAAHVGLQCHPGHPGGRAVNWGGYHEPRAELRELDGSTSPLPGREGDANTRDYPWRVGRPYRFHVQRATTGWAATVTDLVSLEATTVRTLYAGGDRVTGMVAWAELFVHCDDPSGTVRWSGFGARTRAGRWVSPGQLCLRMTPLGAGGCDNLDAMWDRSGGVVVTTGTPRTAPDVDRFPPYPPSPQVSTLA